MITGKIPFLTKGSMALFLGGETLLKDLGDEAPPRGIIYLAMSAIIFQLLNYLFRKILSQKNRSLTEYAKSLRTTVVNNVLNIYGVGLLFVFNWFCFFYLWRYIIITVLLSDYIIVNINHIWFLCRHFKDIEEKNIDEAENGKEIIVPTSVYLMLSIYIFLTLMPYLLSYALR